MPVPDCVFDVDMTKHNTTQIDMSSFNHQSMKLVKDSLPTSYGPFNTTCESKSRGEDVTSVWFNTLPEPFPLIIDILHCVNLVKRNMC